MICKYCERDCKTEDELHYCEDICEFMIECYRSEYQASFEEAKKMFLMELI